MNENFISLEDYQDQCYEEAKEKADSFRNKFKFMIAPDVRSTIFYVITFGCGACFVAYVMNGMLCSLLLGVVIFLLCNANTYFWQCSTQSKLLLDSAYCI